ncbi:MAG: efflux RND transporter permease subunit [Cytophagales bacterium]|nr:efflux RND transporter permease subunit [Cytophagales bacterium]
MLNKIIKFSLTNRLIVIAFAVILMIGGTYTAIDLPVDVLPDLNRPRVTIFLEAEGMAPEEVEALVTLPVETALNGAANVQQVRSNSSIGLGLVFVEFDYGMDIYKARQIVNEKLQTIQEQLPDGVTPVLGPISSVMGQIMLIGLTTDSDNIGTGSTSLAVLRTIADYNIRRRLLSIPGISQVIPTGGDVLQYQVLVSMPRLNAAGLSINQVMDALEKSNLNTTGNFFNKSGSEVLIRNLGRLKSIKQIEDIVIGYKDNIPILISQVAEVKFGAKFKRGDGSLNGIPAVIMTVEKQPNASTIDLTAEVIKALDELKPSLPSDVKINTDVFRQADFIEAALSNVVEALRDGAVLVIIVLFLFLLNFRTTLITLTAIPLSLIITALVFKAFGITINTMTLGGIAIAIGELVDDAIVDVENVFRRLRENRHSENPQPPLKVIYDASTEVRNSIFYATIIVVLVFIPLFALSGMEGRIFAPLGVAYITSIIASLLVALTVTPVMCYYLLPNIKRMKTEEDGFLVRWLKKQDTMLLHFGLSNPKKVLTGAAILFLIAFSFVPFFGTEFLPPFNEGSLTINTVAPTGTSLEESNKLGSIAEKQILKVPEVAFTARRTGRAKLDEHVEPVANSEIEVSFKKDIEKRSRDKIIQDIREKLSILKGVTFNIGQPISHRLDHLLSGVRAQVAIKIFGNDLMELRKYANEIKNTISTVDGVVDIQIEKQVQIPQLLIRPKEDALKYYGLERGEVVQDLEILYQGKVVSQILDKEKRFELILRLPENERSDIDEISRALMETPTGELIPIKEIADIYFENGPNTINHENTQRRMVVSCNVSGRDLGSTVVEIEDKIGQDIKLPQGYFITYGGQFESQKTASRLILILSIFSLAGVFLALYSYFKSSRIVLQVMLNIPLALIGSIIAVMLTGGVFSVASLVGFITLTGIASRNGIMMISHYLHLVEHEGEKFSKKMIIRGSLERLVPVLMTALTAAFALIPLTLAKDAPGKEILYPVATVIIGGLISSTLLDMIVTPVVFHLFGERALKKYLENKNQNEFED